MSAWKPCDIRGLYPDEVNADLVQSVAQAIASRLPQHARVLVAGDFRLSTPELKAAAIAGLIGTGTQVLDAGQIPTPIAYFAHSHFQTDAVLIVTASHNPAEYNGLKLMVGEMPPTVQDLDWLRTHRNGAIRSSYPGGVESMEAVEPYIRWIKRRLSGFAPGNGRRIVLDAGGGAWSKIAPSVFSNAGFQVHKLFCEIDGQFLSRPPDCARATNLTELCAEVRRTRAHLGIAWDGDGDRVAFVDESGTVVPTDKISVLLCRYLLRSHPGAKVAYDIKLSDHVRVAIANSGGKALMERSGHTFLKRSVLQQNCLMGCEASGHYFYRELRGRDDGLFTALLISDLIAHEGSLGSLSAALPRMYLTPELRLPAERLSFETVLSRLKGSLGIESASMLDGIRIATADGFVLARPSVTEPITTFRIEGLHELGLRRLVGRCLEMFPEFSSDIREQIHREDCL